MQRLSIYLQYLLELQNNNETITPKEIASAIMLEPNIVRQDMKSLLGKERITSENRSDMITAISRHTVCRKINAAVLVGVGKLGSALMSYAGFSAYDIDILAGFDINEKIIKKTVYGKPVYHVSQLDKVCKQYHAKVGIITTPGGCAQIICDKLVRCGLTAIWNFTATHLKAPDNVLILNEDMSASLRRLTEYASKTE